MLSSSADPADYKIDTLQLIEVAEGVDILLRPAGPIARAWAYAIDLAIRSVIMILMAICLGFMVIVDEAVLSLFTGLALLLWFSIEWIYYVIFEGGARGASPGKRMMGLKVVRSSGVALGYGPAILRNLLRVVDGLPGFGAMPTGILGIISMLWTKKFQRLGDLVADSVVVYESRMVGVGQPKGYLRRDMDLAAPPAVVPPLPLTREEQQSILQYAERLTGWSPSRRAELAAFLEPLTGLPPQEAVMRLMQYARHIRES